MFIAFIVSLCYTTSLRSNVVHKINFLKIFESYGFICLFNEYDSYIADNLNKTILILLLLKNRKGRNKLIPSLKNEFVKTVLKILL